MKAVKETFYNKDRIILGEAIPLEAPLAITVGVSGVCNLKCIFCSLNDPINPNPVKDIMSLEQFKKMIDELSLFQTKPKKISFAGNGEPLTNKNLIEMMQYVKDSGMFNSIEMFTNGVLLTPEMNLALIQAGLTNLVVSLEAIDDPTFHKVAGVAVDVQKLTDTLRHFYHNKENCNVYIKTVNIAVETPEKREDFYRIYGEIADNINIENVVGFTEYDKNSGQEMDTTVIPNKGIRKHCAHIFKNLNVYSNGDIVACCLSSADHKLGNLKDMNLFEAWNSKKLYQLRIDDLTNNKCDACKHCNPANASPHDSIDDYAEQIYERLISNHGK